MLDPTRRFSNRVENYVRYRPGYPPAIAPLLESECGLTPGSVIADLGSGTGIFSELFLKHGNEVFGVEPNAEMRAAGEKLLAKYPKFSSVDGTAEATTLAAESVDFVAAGQAFHWFDRNRTRSEMVRILKPAGWVVLAWNGFRVESSPLNAAYHELLLRYGTDYQEAGCELNDEEMDSFYAPNRCAKKLFRNRQDFDFEGFKGRLLSMSFTPEPDDPTYEPMLRELREIFDRNQKDDSIVLEYDSPIYYGQLR
jgi:SAM-dependent methyltransferase